MATPRSWQWLSWNPDHPKVVALAIDSFQEQVNLMISDGGDPLEEDFPLGDGVADREAEVCCPHCGETGSIALDPGSGATQDYVEDCPVCCQPWRVRVRYLPDGSAEVWAEAE